MKKSKKFLLLTAGFGEGHNTAAYNVAHALKEYPEVEASVLDIYQVCSPQVTQLLRIGYAFVINKLPVIWESIFNFLNRPGGLEKTLPLMKPFFKALSKALKEEEPDVLISTYPLYSFLLRELRNSFPKEKFPPLITIITDSTAINTSWYRAGSDFFIVPDQESASLLIQDQLPKEKIKVFGFPVATRLSGLPLLEEEKTTPPWKLLYLPSSKKRHTLEVITALLALPNTTLTVVTGKMKKMHQFLSQSELMNNPKWELIDWTDQMPELLTTHHLYIGKAGGATVQEAIAAQIPILVSHIVPGQEEGNIELIERRDVGRLAAHFPATIAASVSEIFANDGATWRRWKENLKAMRTPSASRHIAEFLLRCADGTEL